MIPDARYGCHAAARFWRDPCALLIVCIAGLGTAHILVRTATYGAAVSTYSIMHLSTTMNVLAGEGWRDFSGLVVTGWPPLFPMVLAAGGWIGIEPLETGRLVNAIAFGLTILVAGCWLHSNLRSRWLALVASVAILTALPLSDFASSLLTEPLFVLFTLLALVQLAAFLNRKTDWPPLLWAAAFTALAALTRYPGVVLIAAGVLVLLPLARLKHILAFGAISSVPLLAVLAHNWTVYKSGGNYDPFLENDLVAEILTEGGEEMGSGQSLSEGLNQIVEVFRAWVVPPNAPDGSAYLLWLAVGLVGLAGAAVVLRATRMRSNSHKQDPEATPPSVGLGPMLPFGVFALSYLVFMLVAVPFTVGHGINSRYLLPVYVPLLLAAGLLLDQFLSIKAAGRRVAARYGLASLILLASLAHIGFSAHRNLTITAQAGSAGYGQGTYNSSYWESSEIVNYIRDNRINGLVFSGKPFLTWFWSRTAAPGTHHHLPEDIHNFTSAIMEWTDSDGGYVLWFRQWKPNYDFDELDIRLLPGVEPVVELSDGAIFRVTATEPFDAKRHRARKQRYVQQLIAQADEQVARAGWDVYRTGRKLIYRKEPCALADVQAKLVLHVIPTDPSVLSISRQQHGYDSLGFYFDQRGFRLDDQCIAIAHLPDYAISRIRVGQWISKEDRTVWEAEFLEIGG